MAFCGSCGTQIQDGGRFCPTCGREVAAPAAAAAPVQQPVQPEPIYQPPVQQPGQAYQPEVQQQPVQEQQAYQQPPVQKAPVSEEEEYKTITILTYILFFIPLITGDHKKSPFVKYHLNQSTVLFGLAVIYSIVSSILRSVIKVNRVIFYVPVYTTPGWLSAILTIGSLGILALCILGIYNAATGKTKPLPLIGNLMTIFK